MPSADSRLRDKLTLRFAHSMATSLLHPCFVFLHLLLRLINDRDDMPFDAGIFFLPVFPIIR